MNGVRFERLELRYGRHAGLVELTADRRPFVIAGSNGSGKSTIVEALVRTLYGFRRVKRDDRRAHRRRRPWSGGEYRASVVLAGPEGRVVIERDFETDAVVVRGEGSAEPLFEGEANLARAGETTRRFRSLLRRHLGLGELDPYLRTACVHQGELLATSLSEDLLRLAAGGHADVESAKDRLRTEYHRLTVDPISEDASRRRKPGRLERLEARLEKLEERLREARAAEVKRAPLARARDEAEASASALRGEVDRLEIAFERLSEIEGLEASIEGSRDRLRRLDAAVRRVDESLARFELIRDRADAGPPPSYPGDFPERARALEDGLWPREGALAEEARRVEVELEARGRARGSATMLPAAVLTVAAGLLSLALGFPVPAVVALLAGVGVGVAAVVLSRARAAEAARLRARLESLEADREDVAARVSALLDGVPDAATLRAETLPDRRREFEREAAERSLREDAEVTLRSSMDRAAATLADAFGPGAVEPDGADAAEPDEVRGVELGALERRESGVRPLESGGASLPGGAAGLPDRARDLLRRLQWAAARERDERLAPLKVRLLEASRLAFDLPGSVEPASEAVRAALHDRRERLTKTRDEITALERRIAYEGRPEESALALEHEIGGLHEQVESVRRRAAAYRHAFRLVTEAYEAFRRTDQDRLLTSVSEHLRDLSAGELGPLETEDGLDSARIRAGERSLPVDSPPLSYGQLHAALLAVRLGAAEFLAGLGVRLPLIVDDPFMHLDERRAAQLWTVLRRAAADRQVILATQDRLLLEHLGVAPDLDLDLYPLSSLDPSEPGPEAGALGGTARAGNGRPAEGTEPGAAVRAEESANLELWSGSPEG